MQITYWLNYTIIYCILLDTIHQNYSTPNQINSVIFLKTSHGWTSTSSTIISIESKKILRNGESWFRSMGMSIHSKNVSTCSCTIFQQYLVPVSRCSLPNQIFRIALFCSRNSVVQEGRIPSHAPWNPHKKWQKQAHFRMQMAMPSRVFSSTTCSP